MVSKRGPKWRWGVPFIGMLIVFDGSQAARAQVPDPPTAMAGAVLLGYIAQSDAVDRSGRVVLRKLDASGQIFLPAAPDTTARFDLTPAFRFTEILRGDLTGRTRARAGDLKLLPLSPGTWVIEEAETFSRTGGLIESSSSLAGHSNSVLDTIGFVVQPGSVALLPAISVSPFERLRTPGPASVDHRDETLAALMVLANNRKLAVTPGAWSRITVTCRLLPTKPFHLRPPVSCEPR